MKTLTLSLRRLIVGLTVVAAHTAAGQSFTATRLLPAATPVASSPMPVTMAADAAGNTYVAGGFRGTVQFGSTTLTSIPNSYNLPSLDLYVAKLDPQGNFLWAVRMGSSADDESTDLVRSSSGALYLLGRLAPTVVGTTPLPAGGPFIARLDEQQGNVAWAVPVGNITCTKLATNATGDVLLAGYSNNPIITVGGQHVQQSGFYAAAALLLYATLHRWLLGLA